MYMGESVTSRFAHEKEMHELSVIWNEREFIVLLEKRLADLQLQNSLTAGEANISNQVRPRPGQEVLTKRLFFDFPPGLAANESGNENESGSASGQITIAAITRGGRKRSEQGRF